MPISGTFDRHLFSSPFYLFSSIFDIFKATPYGTGGESLFSRTTFFIVSEFSRTPALNASRGKDHNPLTNSVILAGRNIKGGQTLGASHLIQRKDSPLGISKHTALPVDFSTGEVARTRAMAQAPRFRYITPDRVVATVASAVGVSPQEFHSTDLSKGILGPLLKKS